MVDFNETYHTLPSPPWGPDSHRQELRSFAWRTQDLTLFLLILISLLFGLINYLYH